MKKHLVTFIMLIFILFPISAQKTKDVLYLKNGSIIYGKLIEIFEDQYKIQTSDGSIFIYKSSEVEKFAKKSPFYDGRITDGFGFSLEAGLLIGSQHTDYPAPFSFNFLAGFTSNTRNIISIGSGVEFIGKPFIPLFLEYKYLLFDRKTTPFIFARGGALLHIGVEDSESYVPYDYNPTNYRGGGSFALGSGISWAKEDYDAYLSFAYRYAHTSYDQNDYTRGNTTYENSLNRLEIKFGFKF
jgi:hypothetical protein